MLEKWWKDMWGLWSIRLAFVASSAIAWVAAYPSDWQKIVDMLPETLRPFVGLAAFVLIAYTRLSKQGRSNG